ncbi:50S ribosomal protein L22 [Mageeibacillus indolicus]|uniref:Large ribosomal subunit protein uL22 n=2 Tax=Mageeibacillus indolicus TaxID=884684 RepID=D3QZ96_MAGIU|nr:50S ribosomal protein L22 [Mageeibacillus indolicus]ADC90451.1 ribosomal protein L22 [Mageeibacillus indolicus UPII9-5]KFA57232.1 50S ribosomal protein L22 [Mageeibacillus indolicus 0009-5]
MEKKVMSKDYMLNNRDEILAKYNTARSKSRKAPLLTKKERKVLGIGKDQGLATAKNVRIAPRKVNIVIKLIKNKSLNEALAILQYTPKAASVVLTKLLKSAEANAVNNNELNSDNLYVTSCFANPGPVLKRIMPRARGSANRINKRTSHVTVVLKEKK